MPAPVFTHHPLTNTGCNDANKVNRNMRDIVAWLTDGTFNLTVGSLSYVHGIGVGYIPVSVTNRSFGNSPFYVSGTNVGLGILDLSNGAKLNVSGIINIGGASHAMLGDPSVVITRTISGTNDNGNAHGFGDESIISRTGGISTNSYDDGCRFIGGANYGHHACYQVSVNYASSGRMDNLYGFADTPTITDGAITWRTCIDFSDITKVGGEVDNQAAVRCKPLVNATKNWCIYSESLSVPSWHAGNIGFGSTEYTAQHEITVRGSGTPVISTGEDANNFGWIRWTSSSKQLDITTREGGTYYENTVVCKTGNTLLGNGATNYTNFDATGHQTMVGTAKPWRDELGDALVLKVQGVGVAVNPTEGTQEFATNAHTDDYLYKNVQLNHDKDLSSSIYPHLHWFQDNSATPNFLLQYRWQISTGAKVTPWADRRCILNAVTYTTGTLNQISHASAITVPTGTTLSDIVQFRIIRDTANSSTTFVGSDSYSAVAGILSFDCHFQINSIGSTDEYTK